MKQERISVGCILPACKLYMLQWLPPDITPRGPQVKSVNRSRMLAIDVRSQI